ncbi:GntR family transcriptional regulator [Listeria booriae]|uniref:GntR family transcriptional regulator n=1 Tax=Listeria booriae TaxID=1552123 RepID=UPI0016285BD9|nr:GntR family transcriptional regulator [Listeria booriae]MBC2195880.1 GntR family transcriptional regulator [Listeria booriae]
MIQILTLKEEAYNHITGKIKNKQYLPKERINESQISKELNMSRTPVRQAIVQLEQEGIIEHYLHQGYYVCEKPMDMDTYLNLLDVLTLLINDAILTTEFSKQAIAEITKTIDEMTEATCQQTFIDAQSQFFLKILETKENEFSYEVGLLLIDSLKKLATNEVKQVMMDTKEKTVYFCESTVRHLVNNQKSYALSSMEDLYDYFVLHALKKVY